MFHVKQSVENFLGEPVRLVRLAGGTHIVYRATSTTRDTVLKLYEESPRPFQRESTALRQLPEYGISTPRLLATHDDLGLPLPAVLMSFHVGTGIDEIEADQRALATERLGRLAFELHDRVKQPHGDGLQALFAGAQVTLIDWSEYGKGPLIQDVAEFLVRRATFSPEVSVRDWATWFQLGYGEIPRAELVAAYRSVQARMMAHWNAEGEAGLRRQIQAAEL